MTDGLSGFKCLVTGAGGGIGSAICLRLAEKGAMVAAADVNEEKAALTAKKIEDKGGRCFALVADVSRREDADRMVSLAVEKMKGLDVLVNNAGVATASFIESVTDEEIARVLGVNLIGALMVTRAASPHLRKSQNGRIINVSSVEGIRGSGLVPVYSSSKAGLIGLTRSNAIEFARFGVTVNAVCPGPIDTDMLAPMMANEKFREKVMKGVPLRRVGKPEDVAGVVAFLASPEASFLTGNEIVIDGGMTLKAL